MELEGVYVPYLLNVLFFKTYSAAGSLLLFDKTVLDCLHFIPCFRRMCLISEWLISSTIFRLCIRKPASTRNDQVENPIP